MKHECSIVRDLLPLYAEEMVSPDTAAFVAGHLQGCAACRQEYEQIKAPQAVPQEVNAAPLQTLRRKLRAKRVQTIAVTAVFVIALLVSAFAVLDAPIYPPYDEGLVTVAARGDEGITLTFDESVTNFYCDVYDDPDDSSVCLCDIEAWTTLWDQWFSRGNEHISATIPRRDKPMYLSYVPNDGSETIRLAKYDPTAETQIEMDGETTGVTVLPRLALGYYLILAAAALGILGIVWCFVRKRRNVRVWIERIGLYPIAYMLGHCIVSGIHWATYSINRDFSLILFLSVLLYGGLLLLHNLWYLRREIRALRR